MMEKLKSLFQGRYILATAPDRKIWRVDRKDTNAKVILYKDPNFVHERVPTPSFTVFGYRIDTLYVVGLAVFDLATFMLGAAIGSSIS